ncbi:MAG TPA: DUF3089 domain-containing protein [Chitinophagaceae bacterium]|jgi:hypothetical protein|nr:DUF3089 domain-containing protein [Chitinophagaceae bacterium]
MKRAPFLVAIPLFIAHVAFTQPPHEKSKQSQEVQHKSNSGDIVPPSPDYGNLYYWAAHPGKWDYSDSIPSFLKKEARDTSVDVFFLHPTTYTNNFQNASMNADVNDAILNHQTDIRTILYQASIFNGSCRVFAPRYRQAHLKAYFQINSDQSKQAFDLAYSDLKVAFQYYLDYWNRGRPIIIAAHSQGSMHAVRLLQEFFDGKPLQKQLVCAYIVGWQIKKDDFKNLKFGNLPSQTGCILGWRTYKKGREDFLIKRENGNSLCINPISWTTDSNWTPKEMHKGAVGKEFNKLNSKKIRVKVVPGINILWLEIPEDIEKKSELASRLGNFHIVDYNLFWLDIRENVKQRIDAYVHKK